MSVPWYKSILHAVFLLIAGAALGFYSGGIPARAVAGQADSKGIDYRFDRTISREVLENYLSRSISMEGFLTGKGDFDDNLRMLNKMGAKFAGRSLCLWAGEANFFKNMERVRTNVSRVHQADPEMILQACVFEIVTIQVEQIRVPDWAFTALGMPVEQRNFRYADMLYPDGKRKNQWGRDASVPDISRIETRLWFYFQAASYLDAGIEAIHFGQTEIMNGNDPGSEYWSQTFNLVRTHAARHARRHMVLCDAHVPSGGLLKDGKLLLDFHSFPLRIMEVPDRPQEAILKVGFSDGIYGRSKGGLTFSGWTCDHLPYLVEIDNWGVSKQPGQPKAGSIWIWGYDEITWFAHQSESYRNEWLRYAWKWVRKTDANGHFQMPGSRTLQSPLDGRRWYYANNPSPATPEGYAQEDTIRDIWISEANKTATQTGVAERHDKIRVACIGASITFGAGIQDREKDCYPAQLQRILGDGYEVRNYGVSGRTMLKHGDFPYWNEKAYQQALSFNPNIVVIDLGGNDSKPQNWKFHSEFAADSRAMIESFQALPTKPRVLLCFPMPAFKVMWGINDEVISKEQIPLLLQTATETKSEPVDLHTAFLGKESWFADSIHPNAEGAAEMARVIGTVLNRTSEVVIKHGK